MESATSHLHFLDDTRYAGSEHDGRLLGLFLECVSSPTTCAEKVDQPKLPAIGVSVNMCQRMPWDNCRAVPSHQLPHVLW